MQALHTQLIITLNPDLMIQKSLSTPNENMLKAC